MFRKLKPQSAVDDPVHAYAKLAPHYSELCSKRERYLRAVEREIVARIPANAASLLDIGAGDGIRTKRIADASGIRRVVMVEPSAEMSRRQGNSLENWKLRAEDLRPAEICERFDVITCLWNVLGHVQGTEKRFHALRTIDQLLSPDGIFFLDITNRYNVRSYSVRRTAARFLRDHLLPSDENGDVLADWNVNGNRICTYGHVFTHREVQRLAAGADLQIVERIAIDYDDGALRQFSWQGNLLYVFRRNSRIDSSSAPQTS